MLNIFSLRRAIAATALATLSVAAVPANAVTFNYVGNPFTSVDDPTIGTSVDASVTFDDTVTSDFTGTIYGQSVDFPAWTISSVNSNYSLSSTSAQQFIGGESDYFTFNNGQIVSWCLEGATLPYSPDSLYIGTQSNEPFDTVVVSNNAIQNYNFEQPGTWTVAASPVPLPPERLMVAAGLAGLGLLARRRSVSAIR
jgi:hypothetical protein